MAEEDNPVIGYHIVDKAYQVLGPAGRQVFPALATEERARQAAEKYGRRDEVREVVALHLAGLLSVLTHTTDIVVDGRTAQRLVKACQRRGIRVNKRARRAIKGYKGEPTYSCRKLLGR